MLLADEEVKINNDELANEEPKYVPGYIGEDGLSASARNSVNSGRVK